jgi:cation transport protein ChaC
MGASGKKMRLTEHHVAKVRREIADPGFQAVASNARPATDADYTAVVDSIIAGAPQGDFWVFAYGSLIWNPDFDFDERRVALARGWRRSFCLGWDHRFRGSRETPGLMLALDRGGQCKGVVHRLPAADLEANMHRLIRREMSMVPSAFPPRWIGVDTEAGRLTALTFAIDRGSGRYIGGLDVDAIADVLSTACGFRGSMAEYLFSTVSHLEELGIHDRHLWRLQELVAERIERMG